MSIVDSAWQVDITIKQNRFHYSKKKSKSKHKVPNRHKQPNVPIFVKKKSKFKTKNNFN